MTGQPDLPRFEAMTASELLHEARRWCFNASVAEDRLRQVQAGWQHQRDENVLKLARVRSLLTHRRKTVPMDALRDALRETDAIEAEAGW